MDHTVRISPATVHVHVGRHGALHGAAAALPLHRVVQDVHVVVLLVNRRSCTREERRLVHLDVHAGGPSFGRLHDRFDGVGVAQLTHAAVLVVTDRALRLSRSWGPIQ